jgi:hypothetical protein
MQRVAADRRFRPELARAWREFFGAEAGPCPALPDPAAVSHTRFCEWFLLERFCDAIGEVPVRMASELLGASVAEREALESARVGVFLVRGAGSDAVAVVDLQDGAALEVVPTAGLEVTAGDLLIGRLFVADSGMLVPSAALASVAERESLGRALRADLQGLDLPRRLSQVELEHLLFRRWQAARERAHADEPAERLEARLEAMLREAGMHQHSATGISGELRAASNPGAVVGPLLDHAAFETGADLDKLRVLLLELWNAHHAQQQPAQPPPRASSAATASGFAPREGESLGETLARRIEQGIERHEDLETVYGEVEELLGESIDEDDDEDGGDATGVDMARGDLEALVTEFLWEEKCERGVEARVLGMLVRQQRERPVPKVDLEYLEASDLLRLLVQVFLGSAPADRAAAVHGAFGVLRRFYRWAEATQDYELGATLAACEAEFVGDVERLHRASLALSASQRPDARGAAPIMMRVLAIDGSDVHLQHGSDQSVWVSGASGARDLRAGDILLGGLRPGAPGCGTLDGMVVVLPAGAESVLG